MKSEREVTQSCPTLSDPMDCSLPGSSIHGIFQARVLEWGAISNRSGKIGHPCLFPDLGGSFQLFTTDRMLAVDLSYMWICHMSYMSYYVEGYSLDIHFVENFYHKYMLNFVKFFSASIKMIILFLFFIFLMWCIMFVDLQMLNYRFISGVNSTLSWCIILLM